MAQVQITFKLAMVEGVPVEAMGFSSNETFANASTNSVSTATAKNNDIVVIQCDDKIRVTHGVNPTAVDDDTCELLGAGRHQFSVPRGHKVAVINAA